MDCLKCVDACPSHALDIDRKISCTRFENKSPLRLDKDKCNECDLCVRVCPLGKITTQAKDCSVCIICKNRPGCIQNDARRDSLIISINSIIHLIMLKIQLSIIDT
jgi:ferredoxin